MTRARARQWSRSAYALAALFGSFPIAGRLLLGVWTFEGATGIAGLWLAAGLYLHVRARRLKTVPDPAQLLNAAIEYFRMGDARRAIAVLDLALAQSPRLWQALQWRAQARAALGEIRAALDDLDDAIRLAPGEPHLAEMRQRVAELAAGEA